MDTLVINADGMPVSLLPLSTVSWKDAIMYLYLDKCEVLSYYDDWVVRSANWETRVPAVVMLKDYLRRNTGVRFSKYNILLRDDFKCCYCGTCLNQSTASLDHVIPVSKGGKTNWTNIVSACQPCNFKKADKQHMKPKYAPYKPTYFQLVEKRKNLDINIKHESWKDWIQ